MQMGIGRAKGASTVEAARIAAAGTRDVFTAVAATVASGIAPLN